MQNTPRVRIVISEEGAPFEQHECKVLDYSHSEHSLLIECDEVNRLRKRVDELEKQLNVRPSG